MASIAMLGAATSTWAGNVPAGGQLTLGNSYTNATPTMLATASAFNNDLTGNGASSYFYGDGFAAPQTPIVATGVPSNTYGFYDSFVFTINTSTADAITSTISLSSGGANTQITNLNVALFMVNGNATLPSFSPVNLVNNSLTITNFTLNPGISGTTAVLDPTQALGAGTYVLEIQGLVSGSAGGSYSGVLNVAPVPLAPAWMLLLGGLAGLGFVRRRVAS